MWSELRPHRRGFEADAFTDGRCLVKLWRQQPDRDAALALTAELAAPGAAAARYAVDGFPSLVDGSRAPRSTPYMTLKCWSGLAPVR
jgi:hypothetical protein